MYKVQKLAEIAGVSVRTLHHYDQIGLLQPRIRSEAGYRMYGEAELLRLQQILFFKELDFPLKEIGAILDKPGFDVLEALSYHKKMIEEKLS
ncbi:MAG: MerR family transcriptional regulator, partial [Bacteroidota bacterium]